MIDPANPDFANTPVSDQRPRFTYVPEDVHAPPAVSIVTPFYNTGAVFHETAQSVLQQSLQQFEWIIVNDGSTDAEALAVLDGYRNCDPRIRVIDQAENRGLSAARNTGFVASQTDYVLQLDSDELLEPTAAEKWLWFLTSYPEYAIVEAHTVIFGARQRLLSTGFAAGIEFLSGNRVNTTAMIRRSIHQAVGGYDEAVRDGLEDWEFWLRCANAGYWGHSMPEYLDWRRRRPDPTDRWLNLASEERSRAFHRKLRQRYPRLWEKDGFPHIQPAEQPPFAPIPDALPWANLLRKDKPRLLMIVRCLAMGGGSKFQLDVLEQLTARGWEVTVVTTDDEEHPWQGRYARFTPDIFHLAHMARPTDYPRCLRYLAWSRQADAILLTGSEVGYHLVPYLRAHLPDVPVVDYCHLAEPRRLHGGFPRLSLVYHRLLQETGVSSHHLKMWMVGQGADASKLTVQHTNIDSERWRPDPEMRAQVRAELGIDQSQPVVIFVGRMVGQKQPSVLARTALSLKQRGCRFTLLVAGRGPDLPWLRFFVARHRLQSHVRLLGAVPSDRVRQLLAASDVFFLPSQSEGISLAIYEAMACGLPIVGADVGGQSELVTPECGVLVQPGGEEADVQRYTEVLSELLTHPERGQEMGTAARQRVATLFTIEQMANGMVKLFEEAKGRCADPSARPDPSVGQASATLAVEYMRLVRHAQDLATHKQTGGDPLWRRVLGRLMVWVRYPPARVAPVVRLVKRVIPVSIKSMVKRAFGLP